MTTNTRPDAIIIMVDQMKATASTIYSEYGVKTPGLERLAALGVTYQNATTPVPLCVPARAAMWTAKYSHNTGCFNNKMPIQKGMSHAAKWWKAAGYNTALIGKNHCFNDQVDRDFFDVWCEIEHFGLKDRFPDDNSPRGMDWVESEDNVTQAHRVRNDMPASAHGGSAGHAVTDFEHRHYSTGLLSNQFDAYVRQQQDPYALWLSFPDPHYPYEVPRAYYDRAKAQTINLPPPGPVPGPDLPDRNRVLNNLLRWPDESLDDLREAVTCYLANVLFIDDAINRLLDTLEETGKLANTILVFCSDHGDYAGEFQTMTKGGTFYDCMVRVPMILSAPDQVPAGQVEHSPVSLLDIIPTIFALQGIELPHAVDGQKMVPVKGAKAQTYGYSLYGAGGPDFMLSDHEKMPVKRGRSAFLSTGQQREMAGKRAMVRSPEWKFVHDSMGDLDELYSLVDDPFEHHNLAGKTKYAEIETQLADALEKWRRPKEDPLCVLFS